LVGMGKFPEPWNAHINFVRAVITCFSSNSKPSQRRPSSFAASNEVPEPAKGSHTKPPGDERCSTKYLASSMACFHSWSSFSLPPETTSMNQFQVTFKGRL